MDEAVGTFDVDVIEVCFTSAEEFKAASFSE
jgi:hypothetical protein